MTMQGVLHAPGMTFPEARASLDVAKEESDCPGRAFARVEHRTANRVFRLSRHSRERLPPFNLRIPCGLAAGFLILSEHPRRPERFLR
jgi:hypothetical protein